MSEATTSAETQVGQRQGKGYGAQQQTQMEDGGSTVTYPSVMKVRYHYILSLLNYYQSQKQQILLLLAL